MNHDMREFFKKLIDQLAVLTGVDMLSFIPEDQIDLLITQLVVTGEQDPYHQIPDEAKQRIIMENIYTDASFTRPPYGVKPGLNRRILTKWYRAHWEVHGTRLAVKAEEDKSSNYQRYVKWAKAEGLPIIPEGQYPSEERQREYVLQVARFQQGMERHGS